MLHCELTVRKPPPGLTGKMSPAKAKQAKSNQKALRKYVKETALFTLKVILALFAINFSHEKSVSLSQRELRLLEIILKLPDYEKPVTKWQKSFFRTWDQERCSRPK